MTGSLTEEQQLQAMEKVLRRAEISRITRNLKSRLALASYKTKRGWESLCLDTIEPRIEHEQQQGKLPVHAQAQLQLQAQLRSQQLRRQGAPGATGPNAGTAGSADSTADGDYAFDGESAPIISSLDQINSPHISQTQLLATAHHLNAQSSSIRYHPPAGETSDELSPKRDFFQAFPDSSPSRGPPSTFNGQPIGPPDRLMPAAPSLLPPAAQSTSASGQAELALGPRKRAKTLDGEEQPSIHISQFEDRQFDDDDGSSQPRPPATPRQATRSSKQGDPKTPPRQGDDVGANLLMYLANSPSPAQQRNSSFHSSGYPMSSPFYRPPSTTVTPLTPQAFNVNDYLNITSPSPAQPQRTPDRSLLSSARRRLNFDQPPEGTTSSQLHRLRGSSHLTALR